MISWPSLVLAVVSTLSASSTLYLGHQVMWGSVSVPLRGDLDMRTDTWMLVKMQSVKDGSFHWTQHDCKIRMSPIMGIETAFTDGAVARLPHTVGILSPVAEHSLKGAWQSTWTQMDHDQDGFPGVSVRVDMPLCSGSLYIAMNSQGRASANWVGGELIGEVDLTVARSFLGASNWCLRIGPDREQQALAGVFLLQPAKKIEQCSDVAADAWPNALRDSDSDDPM